MKKTRYRQNRSLQARPRMRVPHLFLPPAYQVNVVKAIRRNNEIDGDDLYGHALEDLVQGENSAVFAELSALIKGVVSRQLNGSEKDAAERFLSGVNRLNDNEDAYPNISRFNKRFLNDRGLPALVTVLVVDAVNLDLPAIDTFRGGETLAAAYGPRRTRRQRILGKRLQAQLKRYPVVDEPAMKEAADRYVEYRFLDQGNLADYKRRSELAGNPRSDRYLRNWFKKFDESFGYPPPPRGRPRNKR